VTEALRIFIADDHPVVRRGVRDLLQSRPHWTVVGEATSGRDAVNLVTQLKPDVVIMDIGLPDMNGLDATAEIIKRSPATEVIVLTMHHSEELVRAVLQSGARGYVLKSDADDALIAAVEALGQHKPFLTASVTKVVLDDYLRRIESNESDIPQTGLTARERQIIQLLAEGKSNKEAAAVLGLSVKTIEAHRANVMRKLRLRSLTDLVRYAIRNRITEV
jgi:DNA-binding NarL/FixJ family response regulator